MYIKIFAIPLSAETDNPSGSIGCCKNHMVSIRFPDFKDDVNNWWNKLYGHLSLKLYLKKYDEYINHNGTAEGNDCSIKDLKKTIKRMLD